MAKNFGRRPITDAAKGQPQTTYIYADEERLDRRPQGKVERFVDKEGNVTSLQLAADGDPHRIQTIDKMRLQFRRKGFVEHAKCPVKHGTSQFTGPIAKDFSALPSNLRAPCDADPKVMARVGHDLHAQHGCQHIEWLIGYRRDKNTEAVRKRNQISDEKAAADAAERELRIATLEVVKEQIAERKAKGRKPRDVRDAE